MCTVSLMGDCDTLSQRNWAVRKGSLAFRHRLVGLVYYRWMTVWVDRWKVYESFVFWQVLVARLLRRYSRSGPLLDLTIVCYLLESVLLPMRMIVLSMRLAVSS